MCEKEQLNTPQPAAFKLDSMQDAEVRYMARQPILDTHNHLHGYELLFQLQSGGHTGGHGIHATRTILDDALLFGLDKLTNGLPAFVTCSAESLSEPLVSVLPPDRTILEIPEQLETSPKMIAACRKLKEMGYRLALEDFSWGAMPHMLLPIVDYVKVDFGILDRPGRDRLHNAIEGTPVALLAEKIDTQESYQRALEEGFSYFQGFYFCFPEFIQKRKVPSNKLLHVALLQQLRSDPLDLKKIAPLVKRDTALVYRLLKLVNSPLCAIRQEILSIESAILTLGEAVFRKMAMLAVLSELNTGQPVEILHMALVRARFCELAAASCNLDPEEQYLLGMLSLLPAMLRQPMKDLAAELPLRPEIKKALLGEPVPERSLLLWIEAHERNEASQAYKVVDLYGLNAQKIEQFYVDAILWEAVAGKGT
ncbi:MAG: HDOD domain-containing protein [Terracidiphilus sp.]|nr:HDOD domain-containing protein [Terracidiphilus sp.]